MYEGLEWELTLLIGLGTMMVPCELFSTKLPRYFLVVVILYQCRSVIYEIHEFSSPSLRTASAVKPLTRHTTLDKSATRRHIYVIGGTARADFKFEKFSITSANGQTLTVIQMCY